MTTAEQLAQLQTRIASLETKQAGYQKEIGAPFAGELTPSEQETLKQLQRRKDALTTDLQVAKSDLRGPDSAMHRCQTALVSLKQSLADVGVRTPECLVPLGCA